MPWRLVTFVVILGLVVIFAAFNTTNTSDISFGFYVVKDVPIFVSLFFAFLIGVVIMAPFLIGTTRKKRLARHEEDSPLPPEIDGPGVTNSDVE